MKNCFISVPVQVMQTAGKSFYSKATINNKKGNNMKQTPEWLPLGSVVTLKEGTRKDPDIPVPENTL